jgi:hypothetical protein
LILQNLKEVTVTCGFGEVGEDPPHPLSVTLMPKLNAKQTALFSGISFKPIVEGVYIINLEQG